MNTFQFCQPCCSHSSMEPSCLASCVPTALIVHEKNAWCPSSLPLQPVGSTCPLTLGRKVTSREIALSLSLLLVPAAVAQPPGGPSLCPCSPVQLGSACCDALLPLLQGPSDFPLQPCLAHGSLEPLLMISYQWFAPCPCGSSWQEREFSSPWLPPSQVFWVHDESIPGLPHHREKGTQ